MALQISKPAIEEHTPPERLLLGPGPSNAYPSVYQAMAKTQVGHMDPHFLKIAEEVKALLRYTWQTENSFTIPVSGTGTAAWEAAIANTTVPGDTHLVFVNGYFGNRHVDMAERYGAQVIRCDQSWGKAFTLNEIRHQLEQHKPSTMWICHAETSTGVCQPLEGIQELCLEFDVLLMVDTVTSIGGIPLFVDQWGIDICYAGSQKCLSCPPGIAPLTIGPRALNKMSKRKGKVANWYLDMSLVQKYLVVSDGAPRVYHHTAPISMMYALREALRNLATEGLEGSWERHREVAEYLWELLENAGLELHVEKSLRLAPLTTVRIPEGVDGQAVCRYLLEKEHIELGAGLGDLAGRVWRIGLMGYNASKSNAERVVTGIQKAIGAQRR